MYDSYEKTQHAKAKEGQMVKNKIKKEWIESHEQIKFTIRILNNSPKEEKGREAVKYII